MKTVLVKLNLTEKQYQSANEVIKIMKESKDPNYNMDKYVQSRISAYFKILEWIQKGIINELLESN